MATLTQAILFHIPARDLHVGHYWISMRDIGTLCNFKYLFNIIHNLCLKLLMFITFNELLCSIVITLSN